MQRDTQHKPKPNNHHAEHNTQQRCQRILNVQNVKYTKQNVCTEYKKKSQPNTQDIAETRATLKDQSHANVAFKYSCALITLIPL